jgi:anaerobic selenocysteine-containing dehydrogenase
MTDKISWVKTHCARMDQGGCGLIVGVKNNSIVEVKGDPDGFLNKGYICPKGLASYDRLTHSSRLKHPLKRTGKRGEGKWEKIEWKEAIDIISDNLLRIKEKHGAKAIAFCQGMPKGLEHFVLIRLANIFGSPNVVAVQDVCHAPREVSGFHTCGFYPVTDYHHKSKLVMLWGSNITSTNEEGEICSLLIEQLKQGAQLLVIDPKKTKMARKAELWLQLKPGTDSALALAFLNVIIEEKLYNAAFVEKWTHGFDQLSSHVKQFTPEKMSKITWVPADLIRKGARLYAEARPAALGWGNPIEQNRHSFDICRSLVCIMAICGNLDVPGGNIKANEPDILGLGKFVRADLIPEKRKEMIHAHHHTIPGLMTVPSSYLKKAILEGIPYPVKGAYFQCTNPMLGYADSKQTFDALMKLDFFAVSDIFMTPTALFADIVLPAATHFEFNDIGHYGLGHGCILARPKVVDPPKDCRPDIEILNELGKSLTNKKYWYNDYNELADALLEPVGLNFNSFAEKGYLKGKDLFEKFISSGFRTPTGKVELALSRAEKLNVSPLPQLNNDFEEDPEYPLILTSAKSRYYLHSSYRWIKKLRKLENHPTTMIHPETAEKHGIKEGDEIFIETRCGRITQFAHLTDTIHPSVIQAAYGWWFPEEDIETGYEWKKSNYNMLTSTENIGKEFGTPNLKGISCKISRK